MEWKVVGALLFSARSKDYFIFLLLDLKCCAQTSLYIIKCMFVVRLKESGEKWMVRITWDLLLSGVGLMDKNTIQSVKDHVYADSPLSWDQFKTKIRYIIAEILCKRLVARRSITANNQWNSHCILYVMAASIRSKSLLYFWNRKMDNLLHYFQVF